MDQASQGPISLLVPNQKPSFAQWQTAYNRREFGVMVAKRLCGNLAGKAGEILEEVKGRPAFFLWRKTMFSL